MASKEKDIFLFLSAWIPTKTKQQILTGNIGTGIKKLTSG